MTYKLMFIGTTDDRVACFLSFTLLPTTQEQLGLAIRNFDGSLKLISCTFAPNFEAISHVTSVL